MGLTQVRIILMEPAGALNVGSVARVMKNFELNRLVLVNPQCDPSSEEAQRMAVHAQEVLTSAQVVPTLAAALVGCHRAIATTGRDDRIPFPVYSPRSLLTQTSLDLAQSTLEVALIFGREDRGLSHAELNQAHQIIAIPTSDRYPSLNLAQAVGICAYELFEAWTAQSSPVTETRPLELSRHARGLNPLERPLPASLDILEGYYQHLEALLLQIGYLYPHTAASRMEKIRQIYHRAGLSDPEVFLLRGILRQTEWALRNR